MSTQFIEFTLILSFGSISFTNFLYLFRIHCFVFLERYPIIECNHLLFGVSLDQFINVGIGSWFFKGEKVRISFYVRIVLLETGFADLTVSIQGIDDAYGLILGRWKVILHFLLNFFVEFFPLFSGIGHKVILFDEFVYFFKC